MQSLHLPPVISIIQSIVDDDVPPPIATTPFHRSLLLLRQDCRREFFCGFGRFGCLLYFHNEVVLSARRRRAVAQGLKKKMSVAGKASPVRQRGLFLGRWDWRQS